ncbi:hypothetical protein GCM10027563_16390 [Parasphingorhabdus pacifica]
MLRSTGLIDAPVATVAAALRHTRTATTGLAEVGVRAWATPSALELLVPGDEIGFRLGVAGIPVRLRTRVVRADADGMSSVLVDGPLRELRHESVLADVGGRTLVTDSLHWTTPGGRLGRVVDVTLMRRVVLGVLAQRMVAVRAVAEAWAERSVVVGAAIVRKGQLLAQQRHFPAADAGRWELPGGRVDPGETEADAVVRECREELDVDVEPAHRIGTDVPLNNGMLLRIHAAELADSSAYPKAVEHRAVRWIDGPDLTGLNWLDADRVLVHSIRDCLRR